jgi:signal transduction histidine kinase
VWIRGRRLIQIIISDITERKRAEERLKETMELKSQFILTVSHELRTPLTCIKEAVEVVLEGAAGQINDRQRHFLDIVKRNIERLAMLINDVLDFQRLESGRSKIDISENDIREVVKSVDETMAPAARQKGLNFAVELDGKLPKTWFDSGKIIQVLTNLISNSIKFTPQGGSVTVSILRQGDELLMRVRDTGLGIPKEDLPKIFERFYRVPRPGKEIKGTGLGLSIVRKIVDLHHGRIEVESEVDKGTTFTIYLPLDARRKPEVLPQEADEALEANLVAASAKKQ